MNINHNRLIPGAITYWGDIVGDLTDQKDLVDYISTHGGGGGGNAEWGQITGNLEDQEDLMNKLSEYASQQWVQDQGYLVQDDLSQYATRQWVTGRGYATEDWVSNDYTNTVVTGAQEKAEENVKDWVVEEGYINQIKTVNNQSLVGTGNVEISGLTPEQEDAISPLVNPEGGLLYTQELGSMVEDYFGAPFTNTTYFQKLYNINGDIYCGVSAKLYKFNPDSLQFEFLFYTTQSINRPMWSDNTGRVYIGCDKQVDMTDGTVTSINMNEGSYGYRNNRHNIWKGKYGIYCLQEYSKKFNESTQEFESWPVTLPDGVAPDSFPAAFAEYCVEYNGHIVYVNYYDMWELIEYEDHIEIVHIDSGSEYFPVTYTDRYYNPQILEVGHIVNVDGDLYYFYNDANYKLVNGNWEWVQIYDKKGIDSNYRNWEIGGIVSGKLLIGFENNHRSGYYNVINVDSTSVIVTTWSAPKNICVDLGSDQVIDGIKTFNNSVRLSHCFIQTVSPLESNTNINLNKASIEATKMDITVPGSHKLNGNTIATTAECIMNRTVIGYGGTLGTIVPSFVNGNPYIAYHFTTHTGRVFKYDYDNQWWYELDGSQWNALATNLSVLDTIGDRVVVSENATYLNYNGYTYLWDDANTDWVQIADCSGFASDYTWFWPDGDTIRYGDSYKLVENGGTYSWEFDSINIYYNGFYAVINSNAYVLTENGEVYQWDGQTKTYTLLGNYYRWTSPRSACFTACGEIFIRYNGDSIRRIDFSKVGGSDQYIDIETDVPYSDTEYYACEYNGYLWYYSDYNNFRYCYDIEEEVPEVPAQDGNYVLKATVLNGDVTYSWVPDNVL